MKFTSFYIISRSIATYVNHSFTQTIIATSIYIERRWNRARCTFCMAVVQHATSTRWRLIAGKNVAHEIPQPLFELPRPYLTVRSLLMTFFYRIQYVYSFMMRNDQTGPTVPTLSNVCRRNDDKLTVN